MLWIEVMALFGGRWPYFVASIGLFYSIFVTSLLGHYLSGSRDIKPAFATATGWLFLTVYFSFRSLVTKFAGVPGYQWWEPAAFCVALVTYSRIKQHPIGPQLKSTLISTAFLSTLGLIFGHFYFFRLTPFSTDPQILSEFLDLYRSHGQIPFEVSSSNPRLPVYPSGLFLLLTPLANPMIFSLQLIQLFPLLSYVLAAWTLAEFVVHSQKPGNSEKLNFKPQLLVILLMLMTPLYFSLKSPFLEGVSKKSVFFPVAFLFVGVCSLSQGRNLREKFCGSLVWFAGLFPFLVNTANFGVSAALLTTALILFLCRSWVERKDSGKAIPLFWGVFVAVVLFLVTLVQDTQFISLGAFKSHACDLFSGKLPSCGLASGKLTLLDTSAIPDRMWWEMLPSYFSDFGQVFLPKSYAVFFWSWQEYLLISTLVASVLLIPRTHAARILGVFFAFVALFYAFTTLQVYSFATFLGKPVFHLISEYSGLAYLNFWIPAVLLLMSYFGSHILDLIAEWSRGSRTERTRGAVVARVLKSILFSALFFAAISGHILSVRDLMQRTRGGQELKASEYVNMIQELGKLLPRDARVFTQGVFFRIGLEDWFFSPGDITSALNIIERNEIIRSSPFLNTKEFELPGQSVYESTCRNLCPWLTEHGADFVVAMGSIRLTLQAHLCGNDSIEKRYSQESCLRKKGEVTLPRSHTRMVVYEKKNP